MFFKDATLDAIANPTYGTLGRYKPTSNTATLSSIANGGVSSNEATSTEETTNMENVEELKRRVSKRYHVNDDAVL